MELKLFREFEVLAEHLNFSRAAEQLNMTQPVLSRHIKYLEEQFQVRLLNRNTHKVELTLAGRLMLEESKKIIAQFESLTLAVRAAKGLGNGKLSVLYLGEATRSFLSSFLGTFRRNHGDITVECCDSELDAVPEAIKKHTCDLAFVIRPHGVAETIASVRHLHLFEDRMCIAVNKNHPLAQRASVSIHEAAKWPVIATSRELSPRSGECNAHFLERYGYKDRIEIECPNLKTCCFYQDIHEEAVVILPRHCSDLMSPNSTLVWLDEEDCKFDIDLIWERENRNPCIDVFVKELSAFSQEHSLAPQSPFPAGREVVLHEAFQSGGLSPLRSANALVGRA
ncbi:LysR family transcriptional regulator [Breoghania corrubedonensis]|uniref:LysR family transcriptional regulator n=1 Tax=Breoghania corrubedonensis TaxID=665038 RepID=A0A2T5V6I3_9HYPH|nr:LysR family transcriptional regulator [Breoghania corrubedonensis]PTW59365.1 LysR family transcriptional regulator [Breoghania corrubedonensis]